MLWLKKSVSAFLISRPCRIYHACKTMTALDTFPFGLGFDLDFGLGRKVVEKTDKLSTRISNTLFDTLMSDKSVAHEVGRHFDTEICKINEQLESIKKDYNKIAVDMERVVSIVQNSYNEKPNHPEKFFDFVVFASNLALGFISIADRRVKNTLKQIQKSEINRSSLSTTIDHLADIEKSIVKIGASYETIIETAEIFKALQETPKKSSSHPELNALLG